ncbi:MAG TPA: glycosyltransferase [Candidatus Limnocylindrales bacterium]
MTSIIVPAHNEACRIGGNLTLLTLGAEPDEFEIIVVANGCSDDTVEVAKSIPGVRVIDLPGAGKAAALRAGDAAATRLTRIYLDADVPLSAHEARALAKAVTTLPGIHAATGWRRIVTRGSSLAVRAFYAVNRRLPAYDDGLHGRGVIAVGPIGRARFEEFPDVIADDLFLDSLFTPEEKCQVNNVSASVIAPRTTVQLVRRLARVRRGNREMRGSHGARPEARTAWLRYVVLPRPWLWPAGIFYAAVVVAAEIMSRRAGLAWGSRD